MERGRGVFVKKISNPIQIPETVIKHEKRCLTATKISPFVGYVYLDLQDPNRQRPLKAEAFRW